MAVYLASVLSFVLAALSLGPLLNDMKPISPR